MTKARFAILFHEADNSRKALYTTVANPSAQLLDIGSGEIISPSLTRLGKREAYRRSTEFSACKGWAQLSLIAPA